MQATADRTEQKTVIITLFLLNSPMPVSAFHVRNATLDDLPALSRLFDAYRQFYQQPADLNKAEDFMRARLGNKQSVIYLAEDGNRLAVGFCQLYPSFCSVIAAPIYVLYDLFVAPEARQSGAARELLARAEEDARQAGFARLDLTTAKTNLPAQALYTSMGWVRDEVFYTYNRDLAPPGGNN